MPLPISTGSSSRRAAFRTYIVVAALASTCNYASAANRRVMLDAARATISSAELHDHAEVLAGDAFEGREAGSRGGQAAARYLQNQLVEAALEPAAGGESYIQHFRGNMRNLLGKVSGTDSALADQYILVGAHYDHVGYGTPRTSYGPWGYIHNGADDNASGVAALLETIEALRAVDYQPRRTILFAFWDGEEKNLLGSRHWVRSPTIPLEQLRLAVNVDMVGRMSNGKLIIGGSRTGRGLRRLLSDRSLSTGMWLDYTWEYKENSDHWPLFQSGIPSLYIHTGLHDDYHRPSDDVERLNIEGIRQTADFLVSAVTRMADADELPKYRSAARFDTPDRQRIQEAPLPPSDKPLRLGLAWRDDPAEPNAVFITRVTPKSPAARAGLLIHDRIYELDGSAFTDAAALLNNVQTRLDSETDRLTFAIERRGRISEVQIELTAPKPDPSL